MLSVCFSCLCLFQAVADPLHLIERERGTVHEMALQVLDMKRAFDMIDEVRFGSGLWSLTSKCTLGSR